MLSESEGLFKTNPIMHKASNLDYRKEASDVASGRVSLIIIGTENMGNA